MPVKEELTRTLQTTSVKGIPRILSSTHPLQRFLWLVFVLFFFSICMLQVWTSVSEYWHEPKTTLVKEKLYNPYSDDPKSLLPGVVLCNNNPFSPNRSVYEAAGALLPEIFHDMVGKKVKKCKPPNCLVTKKFLLNPWAYYQYVGPEVAAAIVPRPFVLGCEVLVLVGSSLSYYPCDQSLVKVSDVPDPNYFNCKVYEHVKQYKYVVVGMSFILYLDTPGKSANETLAGLSPSTPVSVGASISLIEPATPPVRQTDELLIKPGQHSRVLFSIKVRKRLSLESEPCIDSTHRIEMRNNSYTYNQWHCSAICISRLLKKLCNCSATTPYTDLTKDDPDYCESIRFSRQELENNRMCVMNVDHVLSTECAKECGVPCSQMFYPQVVSSSNWPTLSQIRPFFREIIIQNRLEEQFKQHAETYMAMTSGGEVSPVDKLLATKAIEDNFARLTVMLKHHYVEHQEDSLKYTVSSFVSLLGGCLNLWSGISVIVFMELIDFLYRLFSKHCAVNAVNKVKDREVTHVMPYGMEKN